MSSRIAITLSLVSALMALPSPSQADGADIQVTVTTKRDLYTLGAPVAIAVRKCNPTDSPITVTEGCSTCGRDVEVRTETGQLVASDLTGGIQVVIHTTWQPGECTLENFTWKQGQVDFSSGDQVPAGRYVARYFWWPIVDFTTDAYSEPFTILATEIPALSLRGLVLLAGLLAALGLSGLHRLQRNRDQAA